MDERNVVTLTSSSEEDPQGQQVMPQQQGQDITPPRTQDLILQPSQYQMPMYIPTNSSVWIEILINNTQLADFLAQDDSYRMAYQRMGVRIYHQPRRIMPDLLGTAVMVCLDNAPVALAHQAIDGLRDLRAVLHEVRLDFVASNLSDEPQAERLRIIRHHCNSQGLGSEETALMMKFADTPAGIQSLGAEDIIRPNIPVGDRPGQQPVASVSATTLRGTRAEGYRPPAQDPALLEVGPQQPPQAQAEIQASEEYLNQTYGDIYLSSDDTMPHRSEEPSPQLTMVETTTSDDQEETPRPPRPFKPEPRSE